MRRAHDEHGYRLLARSPILCRGRVVPAGPSSQRSTGSTRPGTVRRPDEPVPAAGGRRSSAARSAWLVGHKWATGDAYNWQDEDVDLDDLVDRYRTLYELAPGRIAKLRAQLEAWGARAVSEDRPDEPHPRVLRPPRCRSASIDWDLADPLQVNRLGTLARCSQLIADYEAARRRARPDYENPGELKGARDRGEKYYRWLAIYIQNWARGAWARGSRVRKRLTLDAVDVTTIHQAKGLEWPLVFVPALTDRSVSTIEHERAGRRIGASRPTLFDRDRYMKAPRTTNAGSSTSPRPGRATSFRSRPSPR